ncbi:MAG TPA: cory-CC-star protein [Gemmatimonadales bacterium]
MMERLRARLRAARDIYEGVFVAPYRSQVHREYLRQRDLFLLLGFADLLGVPNPIAFYTLELYPELIDQFHQWHLRMGMPHAPAGGFRCC